MGWKEMNWTDLIFVTACNETLRFYFYLYFSHVLKSAVAWNFAFVKNSFVFIRNGEKE